ncbi:MAG: hypothetical protein DRN29_09510 [Thermoplasmata archaeon]|nr:MAG: hypothetical protein DRN29_09510 [Thermoplasmata archaeon]
MKSHIWQNDESRNKNRKKNKYETYIPVRNMVTLEENLCRIEIVKEGREYVAKAHTQGGVREYRNIVFEDMLRELVIDLQEEFGEL